MTTPQKSKNQQTSLSRDLLGTVRYYLGNRRVLMTLAGIAIVGGLTFNWNWLVAAGIAPILISVLPCAAMCAIGVCCMKKSAAPAESTDDSPPQITSAPTSPAVQDPTLRELPMGDVEQRPGSADATPTLDPENHSLKERKSSDA